MNDKNVDNQISESSPSVQTHLGILQGVIVRMATNSTSAKTWCITIVSAILVLVADKGKPNFAFLAFIPTLLFLALDVYYLALEKGFRNAYNTFIKKIHNKTLTAEDLFSVVPEGNQSILQIEAMKSFSVWGFYLVLSVLILLAKVIVLK
ncbi:MAG: hypothetical protein NT145_07050 [Elusimicrobia bacterium]|nr:hypothetical protein [Elusimicrobiota bacterium]